MSGLLTPPPPVDSPIQFMANISTAGRGHEGNGSGASASVPSVPMAPNPYLPGNRAESVHLAHHSRRSPFLRRLLQVPKPPTTKVAKQEAILWLQPLPNHWETPRLSGPFGRLHRAAFNAMCLMSVGYPELGPLWAAMRLEEDGDESMWVDMTRQISERTGNMLLVAGLLLSSAAAFITTEPPRAAMVDYALRGPYICILGSSALLTGGILASLASLLVISEARPSWVEEVLYSNRFHVHCTLITVSYPFFSIAMGTLLLIFGLLSAMWCAQDFIVQGAGVVALILPASVVVLSGVSYVTARVERRLRKSCEAPGDRGGPRVGMGWA